MRFSQCFLKSLREELEVVLQVGNCAQVNSELELRNGLKWLTLAALMTICLPARCMRLVGFSAYPLPARYFQVYFETKICFIFSTSFGGLKFMMIVERSPVVSN